MPVRSDKALLFLDNDSGVLCDYVGLGSDFRRLLPEGHTQSRAQSARNRVWDIRWCLPETRERQFPLS
jgi:transposase